MLTFIATILLILSNIFIFYILNKQTKIELTKQRVSFVGDQLKIQQEHYNELYQSQVETRRLWHDMNNHLTTISGYLQMDKMNKAKYYISKLTGDLYKVINVVNTGFPAIDAIIKSKQHRAKIANADIIYNFYMISDLLVDEADIAIIIAIGLDNAIEAVEKVKDGCIPINLKVTSSDQQVDILIRNNTDTSVDINNLVTTKNDKLNHGFGLNSIKAIVNKYGGQTEIFYQFNVFELRIKIKNI